MTVGIEHQFVCDLHKSTNEHYEPGAHEKECNEEDYAPDHASQTASDAFSISERKIFQEAPGKRRNEISNESGDSFLHTTRLWIRNLLCLRVGCE